MNETCKLLKKSFYEDEWFTNSFRAIRKKDNLELWYANGWPFFDGHKNNIYIPFIYRYFLWKHFRKGQSKVATEKWLKEKS
jgi:hypothetical protein